MSSITQTPITDPVTFLLNAASNSGALRGVTPLHDAGCSGTVKGLYTLLGEGANIHSHDAFGRTPLHLAAQSGHAEHIRFLLCRGASPFHRDCELRTPLMVACSAGHLRVVEVLLATDLIDTRTVDTWNQSALHYATEADAPDVFIHLIKLGLDYRQRDRFGMSPIHQALKKPQFASWIYAMRLDLDYIQTRPNDDLSVLYIAGMESWRSILRSISPECRAKILVVEARKDLLPLCIAAKKAHISNLKLLLDLGADTELEGRTGTALITACMVGRLDSVKILIRHGAKLDQSSTSSFSNERPYPTNAVMAAKHYKHILQWLLVDRYTEQGKLASTADHDSDSSGRTQTKPRAGVRQLQIPLRGIYSRPYGMSTFDFIRHVYADLEGWRKYVPLGADVLHGLEFFE